MNRRPSSPRPADRPSSHAPRRRRHRVGAAPTPSPPPPPAPRPTADARPDASLASWLVTKLLALVLLSGASGLLYHVATSDDFRIATVVVAGNQLLTGSDLEAAAAVTGANIFWVRQEEVRRRLQTLPAVQTARVSTFLPNRLEIRVSERSPVAVWESGGTPFLVDQDGRVLGSTPTARPLPTIHDVGQRAIRPGASVDPHALETVFRLQTLLPQVAATVPRQFEYSIDNGVTVVADFGPRLRFGGAEDLDWKVTALVAIRRELERTGQRAELIDLRFKDRPYVR